MPRPEIALGVFALRPRCVPVGLFQWGRGMEVLVVMMSPGSAMICLIASFSGELGELGDLEFSHEAGRR